VWEPSDRALRGYYQANRGVEVYDDVFFDQAQQEVDWYKEVSEKTQKAPEEIIQDIQKLRK
jgi:hypothetical protein